MSVQPDEGENISQVNHDSPHSSPLSSIGEEDVALANPSKSRKLSKSSSPHSPQKTPPSSKLRRSGRKILPKAAVEESQHVPVRRAPRKSRWNSENILTSSNSPLAKADLRKLLLHPGAWHVLSDDEKAEVVSLFPDGQHILNPGTAEACPDVPSLKNDDAFRSDCAAYVQHVAEGQFDPEWLQCAWAAHERRKMGDFDDLLNRSFETDWETKLPDELKYRREQPKELTRVDVSDQLVAESATQGAEQSEGTEKTVSDAGAPDDGGKSSDGTVQLEVTKPTDMEKSKEQRVKSPHEESEEHKAGRGHGSPPKLPEAAEDSIPINDELAAKSQDRITTETTETEKEISKVQTTRRREQTTKARDHVSSNEDAHPGSSDGSSSQTGEL
ncbi:hypothetical protein N3K66_006933 [Trichothecium roseum]|uniref:Uncharacterized protein n=1 Tax=Trichothecium roseum TaxID=47278 RepID=A0ACC0UYH9_9HYPO|nr:hypothetical protein N3K66_006933 [Trichothecium roseum]